MIEKKIEKALEDYFDSVSDEKFKEDLAKAGFTFYEYVYSSFKEKYNSKSKYCFSVDDNLYYFYVGDAA